MKFIEKIKENKKNAEIDKYIKMLFKECCEEYKDVADNGVTKIINLVYLDKKVLVGDEAILYRKKQQQNCERLQRILNYAKKEKNFDVANSIIELIEVYGKVSPTSQNPYEDRVQLHLPDDVTNKIIKMDKKLEEFYDKMHQEMLDSIDEVIETIDR